MPGRAFLIPQLLPMEARSTASLPVDEGWQYEPKWDGFRCLAYVAPDEVRLYSKSGKSLARFFPEIVELLARHSAEPCVLDGELVVMVDGRAAFDALQARLHPAESRIARLSRETPAHYVLFDCLQSGAERLIDAPLDARRAALARLVAAFAEPALFLSDATFDIAQARRWLADSGEATDGVIAKRRDDGYHPGPPIAWSAASAMRAASIWSARCCSGCTTTRGALITSASPPVSAGRNAPN